MGADADFWSKVEREGGGCWLWQRAIRRQDGYGVVRFGGRQQQAHRVAYEIVVGPIPDGLTLDHLCRVRHCVNPAHLQPVTNRENILRGVGWTAVNARKTLCSRGHSLSGENLRIERGSRRRCLTCQRDRQRERRRGRR